MKWTGYNLAFKKDWKVYVKKIKLLLSETKRHTTKLTIHSFVLPFIVMIHLDLDIMQFILNV